MAKKAAKKKDRDVLVVASKVREYVKVKSVIHPENSLVS